MGLLIILELAATFYTAVHRISNGRSVGLCHICKLVSLTFIALYNFAMYKKPQGNMLKYAMLVLSASEILSAAQCIKTVLAISILMSYGYLWLSLLLRLLADLIVLNKINIC